MNYYGFVFSESKDAIESVSARKVGVYSLATYEIYDEPPPKNLDTSRVLFIAKSIRKNEVEEAVEAVRNVYNSWCLNQVIESHKSERYQFRNNWTTSAKSCSIQTKGFVYLYRLWQRNDSLEDEAFYVGMSTVGAASRESDHIDETIKAINKKKPLNNSKHIKIRKWLENQNLISKRVDEYFHTYDPEKHNLVNRIVEGVSQIAALAVENFLISHYYGVFNLTNSTNGNSTLKEIQTYFVSRPRVVSIHNELLWYEAIQKFLTSKGNLKQKARFNLQLIAIVDGTSFMQKISNNIGPRLIEDGLPRNIGSDVEWSWKFAQGHGPSWIRFQFRFNATQSSVVINLRLSKSGNLQDFKSGISDKWIDPDFKNDMGKNIYFKPYGIRKSKKTVDTLFNYVDLTEFSTVIKGYPQLRKDNLEIQQLELTLPQAITRLIDVF